MPQHSKCLECGKNFAGEGACPYCGSRVTASTSSSLPKEVKKMTGSASPGDSVDLTKT